jgi:hypothetical protein
LTARIDQRPWRHRSTSGALSPLLSVINEPTARQTVAEVHATLGRSALSDSPPGSASGSTVCVVPRKMTATGPLLPKPTAVHAVSDAHATAVGTIWALLSKGFQVEPFQRSTSDFGPVTPTAVHAVVETQDTPERELSGLGPRPRDAARCTDHAAPFQRSTNGTRRPLATVVAPTAKQDFRDGHETLVSDALPFVGVAIDCGNHCRPSQRSASGVLTTRGPDPIAVATAPMAVQAVTDEHDTEPTLRAPPGLLGGLRMLQPTLVKRSTSGPLGPAPTAMHDLTDGQETADS